MRRGEVKRSGIGTFANDANIKITGPFTLFIPTDKAFRTLLIQLGGPDKAEEKFKENPRLLSGVRNARFLSSTSTYTHHHTSLVRLYQVPR